MPNSTMQLAGPAPSNEAALKLICLKYVVSAQDIRKLLAEVHDKDSGVFADCCAVDYDDSRAAS